MCWNVICVFFANFFAAKRYCLMLFQEEGDIMLHDILSNPNVMLEVQGFCLRIMDLLKREGLHRNLPESEQTDSVL